jgi:hypothetical protein
MYGIFFVFDRGAPPSSLVSNGTLAMRSHVSTFMQKGLAFGKPQHGGI